MEYVWLANFTGCPAINCPASYDRTSGVPIGVMAMGEWGSEEDLIDFARDGDAVLDLPENRPPTETKGDDGEDGKAVKGLRVPSGQGWLDVVHQTHSYLFGHH